VSAGIGRATRYVPLFKKALGSGVGLSSLSKEEQEELAALEATMPHCTTMALRVSTPPIPLNFAIESLDRCQCTRECASSITYGQPFDVMFLEFAGACGGDVARVPAPTSEGWRVDVCEAAARLGHH
jgi:hypothetical protein